MIRLCMGFVTPLITTYMLNVGESKMNIAPTNEKGIVITQQYELWQWYFYNNCKQPLPSHETTRFGDISW